MGIREGRAVSWFRVDMSLGLARCYGRCLSATRPFGRMASRMVFDGPMCMIPPRVCEGCANGTGGLDVYTTCTFHPSSLVGLQDPSLMPPNVLTYIFVHCPLSIDPPAKIDIDI